MSERITKFSPDRIYRYELWRELPDVPKINGDEFVMFIGLNPSTADETKDDPTIRRCKSFAARWGYSWLLMTNLFAFRATDPRVMMKAAENPEGDGNDETLVSNALNAAIVVCAWGLNGKHHFRNVKVKRMLTENGVGMTCLRLTKDGHPEHPLYVPSTTELLPFKLQ